VDSKLLLLALLVVEVSSLIRSTREGEKLANQFCKANLPDQAGFLIFRSHLKVPVSLLNKISQLDRILPKLCFLSNFLNNVILP
jgi:hypothetical protein